MIWQIDANAREAAMSKLTLAFLVLASLAIFDPMRTIHFVGSSAGSLGQQVVPTLARMLWR